MITDAHTKTTTKSRSPPTSLAIVEYGEGAKSTCPTEPQPKHTFQYRRTLIPLLGAQVTDREQQELSDLLQAEKRQLRKTERPPAYAAPPRSPPVNTRDHW